MKSSNGIHGLVAKVVNRETIAYGIAGVLTTIINVVSYYILWNIVGINYLIANIIAWILAVTFAYVVNKINVFQSKSASVKEEWMKILKFYGARIVSFGVEQLGMYVFIDMLLFDNLMVKGTLAIAVIILNYIFSKLYIFHK